MQLHYLTPHQFEGVSPYLDTLIVSSYSPDPLDIAAPIAASRLISDYISAGVLQQIAGRATLVTAGFAPAVASFIDTVEALANQWVHPVKHILWLTDRMLIQDSVMVTTETRTIYCVDWWQWFRQRVPSPRLADAWMYLVHACPEYWPSAERRQLGLPEDMSASMAEEGRKLVNSLEEVILRNLTELWNKNTGNVNMDSAPSQAQ